MKTYNDLINDLKEVCTCIGENRANEGDELCLFCDARLQIEAQQRTIDLLQGQLKARRSQPNAAVVSAAETIDCTDCSHPEACEAAGGC